MGMGEPLLNYKNMMESIEHITSEKGLHMSPKRITVSTAGISRELLKNTVKIESQIIFAPRERAGGQNSEPALGSA